MSLPITRDDLFKPVVLMVIAITLSRLTGLVREATIAYRFGISAQVDAYIVALIIPTILFYFISMSVQNTFIPVYASIREKGDSDSFITGIFLWLLGCIFIFTLLVYVFAPAVVAMIAPGLSGEIKATAVYLSRILIAGIIFMGMGSLLTGYYHINKSFFRPQFVYALQNIVIIFTALMISDQNITMLTYGTLLGMSLLFLGLIPGIRKHGLQIKMPVFFHKKTREMFLLMPPILLGCAAQQLKVVVDNSFASLLAEGSIAALNYANRLFQLPLGLFTMSMLTVLFPTLVNLFQRKEIKEFQKIVFLGYSMIFFLSVPAIAATLILREHIVSLLFERGAFDALATADTASALMFFIFGLVTVGLKELLSFSFFALKDMKTPMLANLLILGVNAVLNYTLMQYLGHGGIALASSLSAGLGAAYLYVAIRGRMDLSVNKEMAGNYLKIIIAAGGMGICLYALVKHFRGFPGTAGFGGQALELAFFIVTGLLVYLGLCRILKVSQIKDIMALIKK